MPRFTFTLDGPTQAILARVSARWSDKGAYIRTAIAEKAARDEQRGEDDAIAQLRAELERVKRHIGLYDE